MLIQWIHTVGTWLKTMVMPFMLLISCESCVCWSCRTSTGNINESYRIVSSWNPETLKWSRGDRCAAVCRAYFTRLAFAPPKESPITPDSSRIVERVLLEKLSQPYKPVSFLIRALLCLIISYPTSSTFSLFQLFILLTTSALGFVDGFFMHFILTHRVPEPRYSQNLVSPAPFFTFDEGHAKKCCELYSVS